MMAQVMSFFSEEFDSSKVRRKSSFVNLKTLDCYDVPLILSLIF